MLKNLRTILREEIAQLIEAKKACPLPTQDVKLNLKNRAKAIKDVGYGPANPNLKNEAFWAKKAEIWEDIPVSEAKTMRCGNCAAFDVSPRMKTCIRAGLDEAAAGWDTVDAGQLGYCHMLKFKCAAKRTCDAWVTGGPIKK
jgi:hypothetical protein